MKIYRQKHLDLTDEEHQRFKEIMFLPKLPRPILRYADQVRQRYGMSLKQSKNVADWIKKDPWRTRVAISDDNKPTRLSIFRTALLWLWVEEVYFWFGFLVVLLIANLVGPSIWPGSNLAWFILGIAASLFTFWNRHQFLPLKEVTVHIHLEE